VFPSIQLLQTYLRQLRSIREVLLEVVTGLKLFSSPVSAFKADVDSIVRVVYALPFKSSDCCCVADPAKPENFGFDICAACAARSTVFLDSLRRLKGSLKEHPLWRNSSTSEVKFGTRQLERQITRQLHSNLLPKFLSDARLSELLTRLAGKVPVEAFDVESKYCQQAPWPYAVIELQKLNMYWSPLDKLEVLLASLNVLRGCLMLVGAPGGDVMLPALGFILYSAQLPNLVANLYYVKQFALIDRGDEEKDSWELFLLATCVTVQVLTQFEAANPST